METIESRSVLLGGVVLVSAVSRYRGGVMVSRAVVVVSIEARRTCRELWCWGLLGGEGLGENMMAGGFGGGTVAILEREDYGS